MNSNTTSPTARYARELISKYIALGYYRRAGRFAEALQRVLDLERIKRGELPLCERH